MFRKGFVKKAEPVVHEERTLDDIWSLRSTVIGEEESFDPNRHTGHLPKEVNLKGGVNPLAFLVGPDEAKKTVTSSTGELIFNHGIGFCTIDAPKAQGAVGFLAKAGPLTLKTLTI